MENWNLQKRMESDVLQLVRKYNVLLKTQIYAFFELEGRDSRVGKALKTLEKERLLYILEGMAASGENALGTWDRGSEKALWVLISLMRQMEVGEHFPVSSGEFPVRIVLTAQTGLYDILYVPETDVTLANRLFSLKKPDGGGHIVIVDSAEYISGIHLADTIGYCTVKEGGEVEYYQKSNIGE
ncbi:MAG: DUF5697 family protein [Lachnospiraceae bacterium]|nr:DUF5697 family protein [Lachnospiraceae bacterium]